jgi:hypothetical protein
VNLGSAFTVPDPILTAPKWALAAAMSVRGYINRTENEGRLLARRMGVEVDAGEITDNVDFVAGGIETARVHGTVTDPRTGHPVEGLTICIEAEESQDQQPLRAGTATVTAADGSYQLFLPLEDNYIFRLYYWYYSEGGSPGLPENAEVGYFELEPGADVQQDFTAPAPLVVPVRYVNLEGEPLQGITGALRVAGGSGGWGGPESDEEGLIIWHGVDPQRTYQAVAWRLNPGGGISTVATSDPFTGESGETIPEVTVALVPYGGFEGVLLDSQGVPIGATEIGFAALLEDGTVRPIQGGRSEGQGEFCFLDALPEGVHPQVFVGRELGEGQLEIAIVENVTVLEGGITDLGVLQLEPISEEEAMQLIGGR